MKVSQKLQILFISIATMLTASCNKIEGFVSLQTPESSNATQGNSTPPEISDAFQKLDLNAYVNGTTYDSTQVMALDKKNNALLLFLPLPPSPFVEFHLNIPEIKGVNISTFQDATNGDRVAVSIPLNLIVCDKVTTLPSSATLPDGRPLPLMPSGEYPSLGLALNLKNREKLYLYFGVNAIGMFMESAYIPEYLGITAPIKNFSETRTLGYFTLVPKNGPSSGGLFLSLLLPKDISTIIDDHLSSIIY